jgi:hypothetical protein
MTEEATNNNPEAWAEQATVLADNFLRLGVDVPFFIKGVATIKLCSMMVSALEAGQESDPNELAFIAATLRDLADRAQLAAVKLMKEQNGVETDQQAECDEEARIAAEESLL